MMTVKILSSGSKGNCYILSDGSTSILLDAGIPIKEIRKGCDFKLSEIAGCFVTHCHKDHSLAVKDLQRAGIKVYMTAREALEVGFIGYNILKPNGADLEQAGGIYKVVRCGTFLILPFPIEHDTPEPVGFLIYSDYSHEKLLYFTDTYYIRNRFHALNYIIGEINYDEDTVAENVKKGHYNSFALKRVFKSHMSLQHFLDFLDANDLSELKRIWICHMSDGNGNEERIKEAVQGATGVQVTIC